MKRLFTLGIILFCFFTIKAQTVSNVTSSTGNGSYPATTSIPITITFSGSVTVNTVGGTPSLALNSGGTATYSSGSGSANLIFTYIVGATDNAADLDYTSTSAISLNGGTISGTLTLPAPGAAGSLGNNKNLVIDTTVPIDFTTGTVVPAGGTVVATYWNSTNTGVTVTVPIDNDATLTGGTVTVKGRKAAGTYGSLTGSYTILATDVSTTHSASVTVTGIAGLPAFADNIQLEFEAIITDKAGNPKTGAASTQLLTVDITKPSATLNQDPGPPTVQADPAFAAPVVFRAVFSEAISGFTNGDITLSGSATGKSTTGVSQFNPPNDGTTWQVNTTATGSGNIVVALAAGTVTDAAGNPNTAAVVTDGQVFYSVEPTANPSNITFSSVVLNAMTVNLGSGGNATTYLLVAKQGTAGAIGAFVPNDGTTYTAVSDFSTSPDIGGGIKILGSGAGPFNVTGLITGTPYDFKVFGFNNAGANANYLTSGAPTGNQTTTTCTYPGALTAVTATPNTASKITVGWTRVTNVENILVLMSVGATPPATIPTDGVHYTGGSLNFGTPPATIAAGEYIMYSNEPDGNLTETVQVTGLSLSQQYSFAVYAYDPATFCYKTPASNATATTLGPIAETTVGNGAGEPGTYTINATNIAANGSAVFSFSVNDPGVDNVDTKITGIVINVDAPNNTVADWSQVIAGAYLTDGSKSIVATGVGLNTITFSGISTTSNQLGFVGDGAGAKTYTVQIWIQNPLSAALKSTIDGLNFSFKVSNSSFTIGGSSSTIAASQSSLSSQPTNVDVVASALTFLKQPPATATATVPFGAANQPVLEAKDAYGNYDTDPIAATVTTTVTNLNPAGAPVGFNNGTMDFSTANTFNYQTAGSAKMVVTTTSPALSVTSAAPTVVTSIVTLGPASNGLATSPLSNALPNNNVLAFSLVTDGGSVNLTGLTVTTASTVPTGQAPNNLMANYTLYTNTIDNFATALPATPVGVGSVANQITFTGLSIPLNGIAKYVYLVVNVKASFPTLHPTMTFSVPNGGLTVSGGSSVTGPTQTSTSFQFNDVTAPTVLAVNRTQNKINSTTLIQVVSVQFSEPMDQTTTPTITLNPTNANFTTSGGNWSANDTYQLTFTHNVTAEQFIAEVPTVTSPSGAKDIGQNNDTGGGTGTSFLVDTQKPTGTTTVSPSPITSNNFNTPGLTIQVVYDEPMNTGINPTIVLSGGSFNAVPAGIWSGGNTYTTTVTHIGTQETITGLTATVTLAQDVNANVQNSSLSNTFNIDTDRPKVNTIVATTPSNASPTKATSVTYTVTFSKAVTGLTGANFTATQVATAPAANGITTGLITVTGSGTTYSVTVNSISGDGQLRLDLTSSLNTILDVDGNKCNTTFTTGGIYQIDNTSPTILSLVPNNISYAVPATSSLHLSFNEFNTTVVRTVTAGKLITVKLFIGGTTVGTIDVAANPGGALTFSTNTLTINLLAAGVTLNPGTRYYLEFDPGTFTDVAGNPFGGFTGAGTWSFQTYDVPYITSIAGTGTAGAACVGQNLAIVGQNFLGYPSLTAGAISSVTFYDNVGGNSHVVSAGITIVDDQHLNITVPTGTLSNISTKTKVKITTVGQNLTGVGLGTNTAGSSLFSNQVDLGPTSAAIALVTPALFEVCNAVSGAIVSRDIKVTTGGGNSPTFNVVYHVAGTIPTAPDPSVGSYVTTNPISVIPPGVGDYTYTITSVTDQNGCATPAASNTGSAVIRKYTAPSITINSTIQPLPICLANSPTATLTIDHTIVGTSTSGQWTTSGNGSFAGSGTETGSPVLTPPTTITKNYSGGSSMVYTFNVQDYATPPILTLTTTNPANIAAVCPNDTKQINITFSTSSSGSISTTYTPAVVCQQAITTVTLTGTVTGGATAGVWQAFDQSGVPVNVTTASSFSSAPAGTYIASVPGLGNNTPGYQTTAVGTAVTVTYTFRAADFLAPNNGNVTFKLIPVGGSCGSASISSPLTVTANPLPAPTPGANPVNVCVGDQKFYTVTNSGGSTYNWTFSDPFFGKITAGQGTSSILVQWAGGPWDTSVSYNSGDVVSDNGVLYSSLAGSNQGNQPSLTPGSWKQITWSNTVTYNSGEVVNYQNAWWKSSIGSNTGNTPAVGPNWSSSSPSLSVVETAAAGCQSNPVPIAINLKVLPVLVIVTPPGRLFGNSNPDIVLSGTATISGSPVAGTTIFGGIGTVQSSTFVWTFSPSQATAGLPVGFSPQNFILSYNFQETATASKCSNTITSQFTVFEAGSGLTLTPTDAHNPPQFCQNITPIDMQLNAAFQSQLQLIGRDLLDFVITDASGTVITTSQSTVGNVITSTAPDGKTIITTLGTLGTPNFGKDSHATFVTNSFQVAAQTTFIVAARYKDSGGIINVLTTQNITINPAPKLNPVLTPVQDPICTGTAPVQLDLRSNDSADPTKFSFGLAQPKTSTTDPNDVTPAVPSDFTPASVTVSTDRYLFNPLNTQPLFSASDFDTKSLLMYYMYTDGNGCSDTTGFTIKINRTPPAPVLPATTVCVSGGVIPTATMTNNVSDSNRGAVVSWFNNVSLTGAPITGADINFTPGNGLGPDQVNASSNGSYNFWTVQTLNACASASTNVTWEVLNVPAFTWDSTYFNRNASNAVKFTVDLGGLSLNQLTWDVYKISNDSSFGPIMQPSPSAGINTASFTFKNPDAYKIKLSAQSITCTSSLLDTAIIVRKVPVTEFNTYAEDFQSSSGGWVPFGRNSSWEYGQKTPSGQIKINMLTKGWVTRATGPYNAGEHSYLYSPAFDIRDLKRPLITFSSWTDSNEGNDGTVLQYSLDDKIIGDPTKSWITLGVQDDGENWYNVPLVQANPSGTLSEPYGWSKADTLIRSTKHVLDDPGNQLITVIGNGTNKSHTVLFRFAFASLNSAIAPDKGGFAMDNVFIGNRTRTVLVENFRNTGNTDASEKVDNDDLNKFVDRNIGTQLLLVDYHLGFPKADPFNQDNLADPSARALYYNITSTPRSRLDGSDGGQPGSPFSVWGSKKYNLETLQLGLATIDLSGVEIQGDSIVFPIKITPTIDLDDRTIMQVAVVEDTTSTATLPSAKQALIANGSQETGFKYTLKKLVPGASGTKTGPLQNAVVYNHKVPFWTIPSQVLNPVTGTTTNLSVIVFLQNDSSKVIYQAEAKTLTYSIPAKITGLEPIPAEQINVFPNPADRELTIQLPGITKSDVPIQFIDPVGHVIPGGVIAAGTNQNKFSTTDFASGLYVILVGSGNGSVARKKVMIVH